VWVEPLQNHLLGAGLGFKKLGVQTGGVAGQLLQREQSLLGSR
jgi:hypothetical protein